MINIFNNTRLENTLICRHLRGCARVHVPISSRQISKLHRVEGMSEVCGELWCIECEVRLLIRDWSWTKYASRVLVLRHERPPVWRLLPFLKRWRPVHVGVPVVLLIAVVEVVATSGLVVVVATVPTVEVVAVTRLIWRTGGIVCDQTKSQ